MDKTFPLNKQQLEALAEKYPTPFYLYDEAAIRQNARQIQEAFSVFPHFYQHFAVKALPNPAIIRILREEGFGADCSSLPELLLAEMAGITGEGIMFSSNETPSHEFRKAAELGAIINLDDITHIAFLEKSLGRLPEIVSLRYNPGPLKMGNSIIGNPIEAKYGFTREQIFEGFQILQKKGVKRFALHTMVASNELNLQYHLETGKLLFELAAEVKDRCGIALELVNLGGGVGIPYKLEQDALDYQELARGLKALFDTIAASAGLAKLGIHTEWGRVVTGPYGWLVSRAIHKKEIFRRYIGLDASMADLMRPALYGAYHHITVAGKEDAPCTETYDVVGSLCENNDKFAVRRALPPIDIGEKSGDLVIIHDAGAHGRAMGFNYNGKLRCGELLLRADGDIIQIRRRETIEDYFATLV
ncbi:MAG: diaminopimelate decarboxylase [Spirochaetaceae bacterium]|nr:diaminopimelate decarboxylase [Spirochaetaceae bacterium]